jgi:integrase
MSTQIALETAREITLGEICQSFIDEELLATSPQTQKWYQCRLGLFLSALGPDRPLSSVEKKDLLAWWRSLDARTRTDPPDLSIETFHGYVRAVRRLFKWLHENHLTIDEIWKSIKLPKLPERTRKGVDDNFVNALIEAARQNPRDLAILLFMESTGARRGGVASLRLDDISPSAPEPYCRRVTVHEKGKRVRQVVMSAEALAALRAWLAVRESGTDFVFTSERSGKDEGLQPGAINQIIARYQKALNIKGRCSPHQWRHRFGRARTMEGMPLGMVSQLMGHSTIVVTAEYYGKLSMDELQTAYDRYYKPHR